MLSLLQLCMFPIWATSRTPLSISTTYHKGDEAIEPCQVALSVLKDRWHSQSRVQELFSMRHSKLWSWGWICVNIVIHSVPLPHCFYPSSSYLAHSALCAKLILPCGQLDIGFVSCMTICSVRYKSANVCFHIWISFASLMRSMM